MADFMRVTIWIPDADMDGLKEAAYQSRKSVSGYLVGLHIDSLGGDFVFGVHTPKNASAGKLAADYFNPMPKGGNR